MASLEIPTAPPTWSEHSAIYEKVFAPTLQLFSESAVKLAAPRIPAHARILDIGCGSGASTLPLAEQGYQVEGTDLSEGMLDVLKSKAEQKKLSIPTKATDGQTLAGYEAESFDAVFSSFGIILFPDRIAGFKAAHRVLKPKGLAVIVTWSEDTPNLKIVEQVAAVGGGAPKKLANPCMTKTGIQAEMEAAGFKILTLRTVHHEFVWASGREVGAAMLKNPLIYELVKEADPSTVADKMAAFFGMDTQSFLEESVNCTGEAFVCIALKE
ncbi:hypothetical protein HDU96_003013 [Phlyctochytrium bullatum]|nr:hypothetical protein HDU96_003013 [Phlyctochytrium bullatum]